MSHPASPALSRETSPAPVVSARYSGLAVALHWLLALAIVIAFTVGWQMADAPPSPARVRWITYHKWMGLTILMLSALRLLWRLSHRPPSMPDSMPPWQHRLAHWVHRLLYALFFAIPVFGWAYSSALGFHVSYLGLIQLPDLVPKDKALAKILLQVHSTLAWSLAALVGLHVAAALKHHFVDKDGLLLRMSLRPERRGTGR